MRRSISIAISAIAIATIVSACGTKGPLYLPPPTPTPPAPAKPAPADDASTAGQR